MSQRHRYKVEHLDDCEGKPRIILDGITILH